MYYYNGVKSGVYLSFDKHYMHLNINNEVYSDYFYFDSIDLTPYYDYLINYYYNYVQ